MKFQSITLIIFLLILTSCAKNSELENALQMAGANRTELEKVLAHYSKDPADSLKLRAAEFLISNMVYHHTFENEKLKAYYAELIKMNNDTTKAANCKTKVDSLAIKYRIDSKDLKIKYDIKNIKADYLIKNIDHSINNFYNNPWMKHLSFDDFCEYILPYRIGNENIEDWREKFATKYLKKIEWIKNIDDSKNSVFWFCNWMNDTLINRGFNIILYNKPCYLKLPPSVLENIKLGPCEDYALSTTYLMRACGIPVCIDFVPQWGNRSMGHAWNVLFEETGKETPFLGGNTTPGFVHKPGEKIAKVFRITYAYQKSSLFHLNKSEKIPSLFNSPFIKDVTEKYTDVLDIQLSLLSKTNKKYVYLAVFDNKNWAPIQWGKVKNKKKALFQAMGKNCMYLPVIYDNGIITPAGTPFYIDNRKNIVELKANNQNRQNFTLTRKYPIKRNIYLASRRAIGCEIIASNNLMFKDSALAGVITRDPVFNWDTLRSKTSNKYRYWKIKGNLNNKCDLAELQFVCEKKNITDTTHLSANILGSDKKRQSTLFDNNKLTYIDFRKDQYEWITVDFGKPVAVDYFRFLPRNDDNAIVAGDKYELMMWSENGWKSLIKCIAKSDKLQFKNVPSGGLYLLHNHSKGNEERIFTYENWKQVWW